VFYFGFIPLFILFVASLMFGKQQVYSRQILRNNCGFLHPCPNAISFKIKQIDVEFTKRIWSPMMESKIYLLILASGIISDCFMLII